MKTNEKQKLTTAEFEEIKELSEEAERKLRNSVDGDYYYTVLFGGNGAFLVAGDVSGKLADNETAIVLSYSVHGGDVDILDTKYINY